MRKLIAGMQISVDGKIEGPAGYADWVDSWADNYDLMPQIDACLLGGGMYPGHEEYWTAIESNTSPVAPGRFTGTVPTAAEIEWARFATQIPHYVLSSTLTSRSGHGLVSCAERRRGCRSQGPAGQGHLPDRGRANGCQPHRCRVGR